MNIKIHWYSLILILRGPAQRTGVGLWFRNVCLWVSVSVCSSPRPFCMFSHLILTSPFLQIRKWIKFPDEADQTRKCQETPAFSTSFRNSLGQSPFIRTVLFCKRIQQFVKIGCLFMYRVALLKEGVLVRPPGASWSCPCPLWAVLT